MFKYKREFPLRVKNIMKSDNVGVLQLLQLNHVEILVKSLFPHLKQTNFSQGRTRHPLIIVVQSDPFKRNNFPTFPVLRLEDGAICTLANLFKLFVLLHIASCLERRSKNVGDNATLYVVFVCRPEFKHHLIESFSFPQQDSETDRFCFSNICGEKMYYFLLVDHKKRSILARG